MKKGFIVLLLFFSGCMVGPNYTPPETTVLDSWDDKRGDSLEIKEKWWEEFKDALLTKYIALAEEHNYDLQAAEANILKAKAIKQIAASKLFPHFGADLNATKTYFSKNGPVFEIGQAAGDVGDTTSAATGLPFVVQIPQIQNLFNALIDASWEIDFFGKTRREVEAASAVLESAIERKNDLLISLFAEVARNYIDLRSFQQKASYFEKKIELTNEQVQITWSCLQAGYVNQLDFEKVQAELASLQGELSPLYSEIYRAIYTLSILIGKPPESLVDELLPFKELPKAPLEVAVGLRSDLLKRRPDVRYAERKLAEATANIGVAVASFFPTITLLANGGLQSLNLPKLFTGASRTWAYGGDVNMPIFEGGRLTGNLSLTRADQAAIAAYYQKTVLEALQEAETNLRKYNQRALSTKEYAEYVRHYENVVTLTRERHLKGLINKLVLLNSEKELIGTQLTLLESKTGELFDLIALYKALGGGWEADINEEAVDTSS